jgi:transcriptional regulator with XRE-family HTH domain
MIAPPSPLSDLIISYISEGGRDLGEFFLGSQARSQIDPPPNPKHCVGRFPGLMPQMGGTFSAMCDQLGMAPKSLKRMIELNHIEKASVIEKLEANLGIGHGTKQDAALWYLARGNKDLPPIDEMIETAQWCMGRRQGTEIHSAARELAVQLFERSGYTHDKLGDLSGHPRLMSDTMQNKDHRFDTIRAEALAGALLSGEDKEKISRLTRLVLGHAAQAVPDDLAAQRRKGEITVRAFLQGLRAHAHLSQRRLAQAVNTHAKDHGIEMHEISQSHIEHWEAGETISKLPVAHALGTVLGLSPQNLDTIPCLEKDKPQLSKKEWLAKIRAGEITFSDYLKEILQQERISQEAFAASIVVSGVPTTWPTLHRWMVEGKRVEPPHAAALAERMG